MPLGKFVKSVGEVILTVAAMALVLWLIGLAYHALGGSPETD